MTETQETQRTEAHRFLAEAQPRLRELGVACAASGALGIIIGGITLSYPAAVPDTQWSYPFPVGAQWTISGVLAVVHALTLAGFAGALAADPHRGNRRATVGLWMSIAGFAGLSVAELLSGAIGESSTSSSNADAVGSLFGIASLLTAAGSIIAGIVIVRSGVWRGIGRWMVLISGLIMLGLVTPANISGDLVFRTTALMLWSLAFIPLGRTIATSGPRGGMTLRLHQQAR